MKRTNWPSIATLGLFYQNQGDQAFMAVSASEFENYAGNTIGSNFLVIILDSGASEYNFDDTAWLRGTLSDYEVLKKPPKITTAGKNQLE